MDSNEELFMTKLFLQEVLNLIFVWVVMPVK